MAADAVPGVGSEPDEDAIAAVGTQPFGTEVPEGEGTGQLTLGRRVGIVARPAELLDDPVPGTPRLWRFPDGDVAQA